MADTDWAFLNDGLDAATVSRGVTAGIERPPGGGRFLFGFNSRAASPGAVALSCALVDFAPLPSGGSIRACIQRGPGGGPLGFAPFLFLCGQGTSVNDAAYLLGLSDDDPHRVVLRKGAISGGVPSEGAGTLLTSAESFVQGTWLHLRLDAIVNDTGDVVLDVFENDLDAHPLGTPPDWRRVDGMPQLIDDALGVTSGSSPLTSGRAGFGFQTRDVTRRGFFDHLELIRQD
ncbi:MAG: hypothetical protein KC619_08695 [Myxococcales bacterium]|nr:hypothetical protein [Myxococcales bacterium]